MDLVQVVVVVVVVVRLVVVVGALLLVEQRSLTPHSLGRAQPLLLANRMAGCTMPWEPVEKQQWVVGVEQSQEMVQGKGTNQTPVPQWPDHCCTTGKEPRMEVGQQAQWAAVVLEGDENQATQSAPSTRQQSLLAWLLLLLGKMALMLVVEMQVQLQQAQWQ